MAPELSLLRSSTVETLVDEHLQARYRNGFSIPKDTCPTSARQDVHLALTAPLDFVRVPVSIIWSGTGAGKSTGKARVQFDLVVQANFTSMDESDQNHMVVDIAAVARNPVGEVVAELSQRIDNHLIPDGLEQIQQHGMTDRNGLHLPPGEYMVRFLVRDSLGIAWEASLRLSRWSRNL